MNMQASCEFKLPPLQLCALYKRRKSSQAHVNSAQARIVLPDGGMRGAVCSRARRVLVRLIFHKVIAMGRRQLRPTACASPAAQQRS